MQIFYFQFQVNRLLRFPYRSGKLHKKVLSQSKARNLIRDGMSASTSPQSGAGAAPARGRRDRSIPAAWRPRAQGSGFQANNEKAEKHDSIYLESSCGNQGYSSLYGVENMKHTQKIEY